MKNHGYIYILTNPSFPDYIKIGYATNIEERLEQLNRSECMPFAFRVYATYEVETPLSDKSVHEIIDRLNPSLRAIETVNGKRRVREFYAMSKEEAYSLLELMAKIHNCSDKLRIIKPTAAERKEEAVAEEIEKITRGEFFSFDKCHIPKGAVLEYVKDSSITCTVVGDRHIEYDGEIMYMTTLAKMLTGKKNGIAGPLFFNYNGKNLQEYYNEFQAAENGSKVAIISKIRQDQVDPKDTIKKSDAILLLQKAGISVPKQCTFASLNKNGRYYWANPDVSVLLNDWWIVLNDNIKRELHCFLVPANTYNEHQFKIRKDRNAIDYEVVYDNAGFIDKRSKINFKQWLLQTLNY